MYRSDDSVRFYLGPRTHASHLSLPTHLLARSRQRRLVRRRAAHRRGERTLCFETSPKRRRCCADSAYVQRRTKMSRAGGNWPRTEADAVEGELVGHVSAASADAAMYPTDAVSCADIAVTAHQNQLMGPPARMISLLRTLPTKRASRPSYNANPRRFPPFKVPASPL